MERRHAEATATDASRSSTLFTSGGGGMAAELLGLQQTIGNTAVTSLLDSAQRAPDDAEVTAAEMVLTPEQVASAMSFYRSQPEQYSPEIVSQIQAAVGVATTGSVDVATVQGVAAWQRDQGSGDPPLVVDGMAGPRTLPRLFASGLNAPGHGQAFGEAAQTEVIDRWDELTPQERGTELVRLVNVHLEAAGIPPVAANIEDGGSTLGSFAFTTWTMDIGEVALKDEHLTLAEAKDVVNTIYHEARHAEQWFRMAQLRAGQGRTGAQIATETAIPANITEIAAGQPLEPGSMEALVAKGWYDSVYGSGRVHREAVLTELERADEALDAAVERFKADPTPANRAEARAARTRRTAAFNAYRELPEENDAWATGPLAESGVTAGSPEPVEAEAATEAEGGAATEIEPAPDAGAPAPTPEPGELGEPPAESSATELGPLAAELAALLASFAGEAAQAADVVA